MGKQVRFYMTHEDEKNFLASISDLAPVRLVYQTFTEPSHMELESFMPVGHCGGNFHPNYFRNAHLCLVNATLGTPPKVDSYPQHSYRSIDLAESEVVEFTRCEPFKARLTAGRLWFAEQTIHVRKSDAFVKWANSLLKWVRRKYERDARGVYVAANALELSKAGKLQLGPSDEPELSLEERKRILGIQ
jgi:hypothetical protein